VIVAGPAAKARKPCTPKQVAAHAELAGGGVGVEAGVAVGLLVFGEVAQDPRTGLLTLALDLAISDHPRVAHQRASRLVAR
jgi:hypothetical protein